jgi:hypothetical protein
VLSEAKTEQTKMTANTWIKQTFSNGDVSYFQARGMCANGSIKGVSIFVDPTVRRKLRAKCDTVPSAFRDLWVSVDESNVPEAVKAAAAQK